MISLLRNLSFYIILLTLILIFGIYFFIASTVPTGGILQVTKLDQIFGLISITYLYICLIGSPFYSLYPNAPLKNKYLKSVKGFYISTLGLIIIHGFFSFFGELGGFLGLGYLNNKYLLAMGFGFSAFLIFLIITILGSFIAKTEIFKKIRKLSYVGGFLVAVHVLMLGTNFNDLSTLIPQIFFIALFFLLLLESLRFDKYINQKLNLQPGFGISFVVLISIISTGVFYILFPQSGQAPSLGIHALHVQIAKEALSQSEQQNSTTPNFSNIPGLNGDRTRRFTASFIHPDVVNSNQDASLLFQVYDAANGNRIGIFSTLYEKPLHLIIVDNELKYYSHIHPTLTDNGFTINTQFPHAGRYHIYLDFQPLGAIEQQIGFTLDVGTVENPAISNIPVDTNLEKSFGDYSVKLTKPDILNSEQLSIGNQKLRFTILDSKTKNPITNLKPYLAAFGHLVMINEKTYDYLHVHPTNIVPPAPNSNGGPDVEFIPLGLYSPIKPGIYRVFAQFNPDNKLFTADFTVEIN